MEGAILEIIKAVPVAGVMLVMMIQFLRSLEKRDEKLNAIQKDWSTAMEKAVETANMTIERNTDALINVKGVIEHCRARQVT